MCLCGKIEPHRHIKKHRNHIACTIMIQAINGFQLHKGLRIILQQLFCFKTVLSVQFTEEITGKEETGH